MEYNESFKQRVQQALNNPKVDSLLSQNSEFVGRYLDDARQIKIDPRNVVAAIESKNLEPLYNEAKKLVEIDELYGEWIDQYRNQNQMHM